MLLDNSSEKEKICTWIEKFNTGNIDIVTGYFTVNALSYLAQETNNKIKEYRFILGELVQSVEEKIKCLDVLDLQLFTKEALRLRQSAKEAVDFLSQEKVKIKTLEPDFCHAKVYLYENPDNTLDNFYITGSSNLTGPGIGLTETSNVELNLSGSVSNYDDTYYKIRGWFINLWNKKEAHDTIDGKDGKKILFKQFLIDEISRIFKEYSPETIYYKILFEMFGYEPLLENDDIDRGIRRLKDTKIYEALYPFQKQGAISIILKLEKYNGTILADAVGLGKTWTALAVIKFYQMRGYDVIVLCPKRLGENWRKFRKNYNSVLEDDKFEYFLRFHTDLNENRLKKYDDREDKLFVNDKNKLFVIDESHNFRNDKTKRYEFFVENILQKNKGDVKVLMLSATPINNTFIDIRNQYKLMVRGQNDGFKDKEKINIDNLEYIFKQATETQNEWIKKENPHISDLIKKLPRKLRKLLDELLVARTRKFVIETEKISTIAEKKPPENITGIDLEIGKYKCSNDLLNAMPTRLSAYLPAFYAERTSSKTIEDEKQRDWFLVKMMNILLAKRLESSWISFKKTLEKMLKKHRAVLDILNKYEKSKSVNVEEVDMTDIIEEDEIDPEDEDEFMLEAKRKIKVKEIDQAGNLKPYVDDLKEDIKAMENLLEALDKFRPEQDKKLEKLIKLIEHKQKNPINKNNKKIIIFTVYADTAIYLFEELSNGEAQFDNIAVVTGQYAKVKNESETKTKNYEPILERFAPIAKGKSDNGNPIDILIATDCISEGQNLQDCDYVINYDIHWNPLRLIQRFGRIDRIITFNKTIAAVNFWPPEDMEDYLKLKSRVEERMAIMKVAGSDILNISDRQIKISESEKLEEKQRKKMLEYTKHSLDEIEDDNTLKLNKFSLEHFKEDLFEELNQQSEYYKKLPNGIFSGVIETTKQSGIIAFLKYRLSKEKEYELIYINLDGEPIETEQKDILDFLKSHKKSQRYVPNSIDFCEDVDVLKYSNAINNWFNNQREPKIKDKANAFIDNISKGQITLIKETEKTEKIENMYTSERWDLLCWLIVSNKDN